MMEKAPALGQNPKLPQQPMPAGPPASSAAGGEVCELVWGKYAAWRTAGHGWW